MNATRRGRALRIHSLESLDDRITPSGGISGHAAAAFAPIHVFQPTAAVAPVAVAHTVSVSIPTRAVLPVSASVPTYSPQGSPMDKLGQTLNIIYQEYLTTFKNAAQGPFASSQASKVFFRLPAGTTDGSKTEVGVNIQVSPGNFTQALADMTKFGMEVGPTDAAHGIITGYLPVSQLAAAANDAQITNITPMFKPPTLVPFNPRR